MRSSKPILLVEDDQVDAMTVKRALKEIKVSNSLDIVANGEEALSFLRNPENEKPGIILLDLNMPKMNGIEFLKVAKKGSSPNQLATLREMDKILIQDGHPVTPKGIWFNKQEKPILKETCDVHTQYSTLFPLSSN